METQKNIPCPECNGRGVITHYEDFGIGGRVWNESCHKCSGMGTIKAPMTNAEQIRTMNDEELVEFLMRFYDDAHEDGYENGYSDGVDRPRYRHPKNQTDIMKWLQETEAAN